MTILYFARMDVEPSFLNLFEDWYDTVHAPDLLKSGFFSCSAFYATDGEPLVHNVYLIPSTDIFNSPGYLTARDPKNDAFRPTVLENVSNRSNTPYAQLSVINVAESDIPIATQSATVQFNSTDEKDIVQQRFLNIFSSLPIASRLCIRSGSHLNASTEPNWLILIQPIRESDSQFASSYIDNFLSNSEIDIKRQVVTHRVTFTR